MKSFTNHLSFSAPPYFSSFGYTNRGDRKCERAFRLILI